MNIEIVDRARHVARCAHAGQVDKLGEPYILHPLAVASYLDTDDQRTVALLHDVLEDTNITEAYLRDRFPTHCIDAVVALTQKPNEPRTDYRARIKANPLAVTVKLADIKHNTDPERMAGLSADVRERLTRKYAADVDDLAPSLLPRSQGDNQ